MSGRAFMTYPIPMEDEEGPFGSCIATLRIPTDLTRAEAERIAAYVSALVTQDATVSVGLTEDEIAKVADYVYGPEATQ